MHREWTCLSQGNSKIKNKYYKRACAYTYNTCKYICTHTDTHTNAHSHTDTHTHRDTHSHTHTHTHTHTHAHTTHTHTSACTGKHTHMLSRHMHTSKHHIHMTCDKQRFELGWQEWGPSTLTADLLKLVTKGGFCLVGTAAVFWASACCCQCLFSVCKNTKSQNS